MAAQPLVSEAARTHDIVVWASVDPSDGSVTLYDSPLAATFENDLAAFAHGADDICQNGFNLPLPNGAVLRASLFMQKAENTITVEQFTNGGRRWGMRLLLGMNRKLVVEKKQINILILKN